MNLLSETNKEMLYSVPSNHYPSKDLGYERPTYDVGRFGLSLRMIRSPRAKSLLNIGCGSRPWLEEAVKNLMNLVVSMDINLTNLKMAKGKLKWLNAVRADAHHLPFRSEVLEHVVMLEVLEHLAHDNLALAEISRVLGCSGKLVLSVPSKSWLNKFDFIFRREHYRHYTQNQIEHKLSTAGLNVKLIKIRGGLLEPLRFYLDLLISRLSRRRISFSAEQLPKPLRGLIDAEYESTKIPFFLSRCIFAKAEKI
jgi:SAM-dependent methyltransferase